MASWAQRGDAPAYGTGVVGLGARLVDDGRWGGSVPSPDPMGPSTLAMPAVPHFAESGSYGGWSAAQNSQDVGPPIQEQRVSPDSGGTGVLPDQVEIGSVVEIFSKGLQAWFVGLVVQESADREVIRIRFMVGDEPKEKALKKGDSELCHQVGTHVAMIPPGWQRVPSQSRPGQVAYFCPSTGLKYATMAQAWQVHLEAQLDGGGTVSYSQQAPMSNPLLESPPRQEHVASRVAPVVVSQPPPPAPRAGPRIAGGRDPQPGPTSAAVEVRGPGQAFVPTPALDAAGPSFAGYSGFHGTFSDTPVRAQPSSTGFSRSPATPQRALGKCIDSPSSLGEPPVPYFAPPPAAAKQAAYLAANGSDAVAPGKSRDAQAAADRLTSGLRPVQSRPADPSRVGNWSDDPFSQFRSAADGRLSGAGVTYYPSSSSELPRF
mmetsp:Transcript_53060/g.121075  ORF Transcript_53060/g.121075 Transcript_53060/m.121075 type:complete len:432 (-) Transcript_53060:656-1951(-)